MPSLSPTHIPVRSYFPSDHFFILRKDHAMLLGEQAAQQTPGLESVRRIGVGVECSSVAPFAFLVLPTCAVANMGQREHKQQLFCFCFFKCGDVVGTHARPLTCAKPTCICAGTLRFQWAAWESGRLLRPVVFDAVCWDEETHKHFYVLAWRKLNAHFSFFFACNLSHLCLALRTSRRRRRLTRGLCKARALVKQSGNKKAGSPRVICELCLWQVLCL